MPSDNTPPIDLFARNIVEKRFEAFDPAVVRHAKDRIMDTVGCLIGGYADSGNPELIRMLKDEGGKPESTILIFGGKVPAGQAAMANCIMCRSFDFEPVSPVVNGRLTPGHISGTTVMTALSTAEACRASGRDMIAALILGDDLTARVLATSGFSLDLGWDGNGTGNALGATAIAGRLLGLNPTQMRHAFGLVLNQMGGTMQNIWDGTPAFKLPQGLSARNGIFSARLAAAGWTGPRDALLSRNGYYYLYTKGFSNEESLLKDLGSYYCADRTFKPYPSCRATHGAIDCALALARKHTVQTDQIREASLLLPGSAIDNFCGKPLQFDEFPHCAAAFSYQYTTAVALRYKNVAPAHFSATALADPETMALARKIRLVQWPQTSQRGTGLKLEMTDGRELIETCGVPRGDLDANPMSRAELIEKFMTNVDYSGKISAAQAKNLLDLLENLEQLDTLDRVIDLLTV